MAIKSSYLFASTCSLLLSLSFLPLQIASAYAQDVVTKEATKGATKGQKVRYIPPKDIGILKISLPGIFRNPPEKCDPTIDVSCLSALVPDADLKLNPPPLTLSARPTFFFSMPQVRGRASFKLYDVDNAGKLRQIYSTTFQVDSPAGVIGYTMPVNAPELKVNKIYAWRFTLGNLYKDEFKEVRGSIQRVELSPGLSKQLENSLPLERASVYANLGIWYDSVKILAELQRENPDRKKPLPEWVDLLKSANLDQLATRPFTNMSP
ncbi:DUF928 domain-containing protein [Tumidithrix elongata RA019]|uniref:DUF928 domain-containing protein n=1 Tax=Tumidithrix elongata BACA0141 TaxID=2716417 RepID=A0AAW9PTZ0_9CYAN|nr:DUF928 domain-containing protein [Tumidithrix elongata RA019]